MIHTKYCKKCKTAFDIGTNYDLCPKCRKKEKKPSLIIKSWRKLNGTKRI